MERVAFLIERTGERIECLLNPDTFTITRRAGVRPVKTLAGALTGTATTDDPLMCTGGGVTELVLELLFDMSKVPNAGPDDSVQTLTAPLWAMAENSDDSGGIGVPPDMRFVYGKEFNVAAVVVDVAERFEQFTPSGVPRRSWIKMRLLRTAHNDQSVAAQAPMPRSQEVTLPEPESVPAEDLIVHEVQGERANNDDGGGAAERIDQLAQRYYGDASMWRVLAAFNDVDDPARLPPGKALLVPPLASGSA